MLPFDLKFLTNKEKRLKKELGLKSEAIPQQEAAKSIFQVFT